MSLYYDRAGEPMTSADWRAASLAAEESREAFLRIMCVARTEVGDLTVSTIWLGMDHSHGRGRPVIFETMILNTFFQIRHHTEDEAKTAHDRVVARLGAGANPDELGAGDFQ